MNDLFSLHQNNDINLPVIVVEIDTRFACPSFINTKIIVDNLHVAFELCWSKTCYDQNEYLQVKTHAR